LFSFRASKARSAAAFSTTGPECGCAAAHRREFFQDLRLSGQKFALLDERPDDMDAHLHRLRAVEDIRGHECAVLGESVGEVFDMFWPLFKVTVCDLENTTSLASSLES